MFTVTRSLRIRFSCVFCYLPLHVFLITSLPAHVIVCSSLIDSTCALIITNSCVFKSVFFHCLVSIAHWSSVPSPFLNVSVCVKNVPVVVGPSFVFFGLLPTSAHLFLTPCPPPIYVSFLVLFLIINKHLKTEPALPGNLR